MPQARPSEPSGLTMLGDDPAFGEVVRLYRHPSNEKAFTFWQMATIDEREMKERAESSSDEPIIPYIGSDNSEDRYGSIIEPSGWKTKSYMADGEGVFLWAHDYKELPIGKTVRLVSEKNRWLFTVRYAVEDYDFANTTYKLAKGRYIKGVSIGFIPLKSEPYEAKTVPSWMAENKRYTEVELLELSQVPVPANRNAIQLALKDRVISDNEVRNGLELLVVDEAPYVVMSRMLTESRQMAERRVSDDDEVAGAGDAVDSGKGDAAVQKRAKSDDPATAEDVAPPAVDAETSEAKPDGQRAACGTCGAEGCGCGGDCTDVGCGCCAGCEKMKTASAPTTEVRAQDAPAGDGRLNIEVKIDEALIAKLAAGGDARAAAVIELINRAKAPGGDVEGVVSKMADVMQQILDGASGLSADQKSALVDDLNEILADIEDCYGSMSAGGDDAADEQAQKKKALVAKMMRCMDCYGGYSSYSEVEVTDEEKAAEIAAMQGLAGVFLAMIDAGLAAWEVAEHADLGYIGKNAVYSGMWSYDSIVAYAQAWYAVDLDDQLTDAQRSVASAARAAIRESNGSGARKGAKLSKADKEKLKKVHDELTKFMLDNGAIDDGKDAVDDAVDAVNDPATTAEQDSAVVEDDASRITETRAEETSCISADNVVKEIRLQIPALAQEGGQRDEPSGAVTDSSARGQGSAAPEPPKTNYLKLILNS